MEWRVDEGDGFVTVIDCPQSSGKSSVTVRLRLWLKMWIRNRTAPPMTICWICLRLKAVGRGGQTLRESRAATPRENTSTEPPNLFDFWYNIHCQNGNVTGLIASRREPPQSGRQDSDFDAKARLQRFRFFDEYGRKW